MNLATEIHSRLSRMSYAEREAVSAATGVPFDTIQKIAIGQTKDPRYSTVEALAEYFGAVCAVPRSPSFCDSQ